MAEHAAAAADEAAWREIVIVRVYDAPREDVWRAWTEPERLAQWWGKRGWTAVPSTITMDLRPGGAFCVTTVDGDGGEMTTRGVYREVREPVRLVFGNDDGAVSTVTFRDLGDGRTEMAFHTTIHATDNLRRAAQGGLSSAFDRLAEHLA